MFLPGLTADSTETTRYDYIQAAESKVMEVLFAGYIAGLIAENVARAQAQQSALNVADVDIAGGGDGSTFVLRILVTTVLADTNWADTDLPAVQGRFWMGSDAEALADYQEAAIASLIDAGTGINTVAVGHAGSSKGTRFMAFMAAVIES